MPLFGKQQIIADKTFKALTSNNIYLQKCIYIAGEMGVGKTYIASYLANKFYQKKESLLIISPVATIKKWQKVIKAYTGVEPFMYKRSYNHKQTDTTGFDDPQIFIVKETDINVFYKDNPNTKYCLTILDEVHHLKYGASSFITIKTIIKNQQNAQRPITAMTGTIFNKNLYKLAPIFQVTHPNLFKLRLPSSYNKYNRFNKHYQTVDLFLSDFWQYIAFSISMTDVQDYFKKDTDDEIEQTISPIRLIAPTTEQILFYRITTHQFQAAGNSLRDSQFLAAQRLDNPENNQNITKKHHILHRASNILEEKDQRLRTSYNTTVVPALTLTEIKLNKTEKYKKLIKILQNKEKTLIFVNQLPLINKLVDNLNKDHIKTSCLTKDIPPEEYSAYINECLADGSQAFIINPKAISTGVDINTASQIVWYQLLDDLTETLQAQRRVYRLSSTKSSTIHYLAYGQTQQENLIKEISNNAKNNALSYGNRETNNLAKLTGILFPEIK